MGTESESAHKVRREFSNRSCQDSNSQPFDHKSSALTNKLSWLPVVLVVVMQRAKKCICYNFTPKGETFLLKSDPCALYLVAPYL